MSNIKNIPGMQYSYLSEKRNKNGYRIIVDIPDHIPRSQHVLYRLRREEKEEKNA